MSTAFYVTPSPNDAIDLGRGPVAVELAGERIEGEATMQLRWLPSPRVEIVGTFENGMPFWKSDKQSIEDDDLRLEFPTLGITSEVQVRGKSLGREARVTASFKDFGLPDPLPECDAIEFHVPNTPELYANLPPNGGPQRFKRTLTLVSDRWTVEVQPVDGIHDLVAKLSESGGYGITYHGTARRNDGLSIDSGAATPLLDCLNEFFSFAFGHRVPPVLARGKRGDDIVWQERKVRHLDPWHSGLIWLDRHRSESLEEAFPGFAKLFDDAVWSRPLRSAVYWFTNANVAAGGVDTAIVLSQAALELIAWTWLVQDRQSISPDGFEKLTAADKIRLVLSVADIPLRIPAELSELLKAARAFNWTDGPSAVTALRNSIVHPNLERRFKYTDAIVDVWLLSQWYVELLLLRRMGFRGYYGSRLRSRWTGQVELVPWAV